MKVRDLTNKEFDELRMIVLFKLLDSQEIDFENMANYVLDNITININSLINPGVVPGTNRLLIDKLTVLLKEILKGRKELKETFYGLLETININDIPKCVRLFILLKIFIESRSLKVSAKHKYLLAAIESESKIRIDIDLYQLEINDIEVQAVIKQDGYFKRVETYSAKNKAALVIKYDIKEKKIVEKFVSFLHEKTQTINI